MQRHFLIYLILHVSSCLAFTPAYNKRTLPHRLSELSAKSEQYALLFDCDGVIVETEELHRIAYNAAFSKFGLILDAPGNKAVVWDTAYYDILQNTVGGGKPKMFHYFNNDAKAWPISTRPYERTPQTDEEKKNLVDMLQDAKTVSYCEIIENMASAREGVLELMDEAIANKDLKVGICSAATKGGFDKLVNAIVGPARLAKLDIVIAGDDVSKKKPDPMIYNLASQKLGVKPENCVVIEDSIVGLKAAKSANMNCIITYTESTRKEDFYGTGADAILGNLKGISLTDIFAPLMAGNKELLAKQRDSKPGDQVTSNTATIPVKTTTSSASPPPAATPAPVEKPKEVETPRYTGWTPHFMIVKPSN